MALPSIPNIQMSLCSPMREMPMRKNVLVLASLGLLSAAAAARPRDIQTPTLKPPAIIDVAMIAVEGEGAKYWPRWRGPSGQGLAMDKGYVDKWSDTENVKWKTKLETTGNGSPIVWANRIFITTGS